MFYRISGHHGHAKLTHKINHHSPHPQPPYTPTFAKEKLRGSGVTVLVPFICPLIAPLSWWSNNVLPF